MPGVPGLNIVVAGENNARLNAALAVAAAWSALDRPARIFLQAEAVCMLGAPSSEADLRRSEAGLPLLNDLLAEALALGASVTACQSGLSLTGLSAEDLPEGVDVGGLVGFLAKCRPDDQLMIA
jgi:predicted peroxiredoxin